MAKKRKTAKKKTVKKKAAVKKKTTKKAVAKKSKKKTAVSKTSAKKVTKKKKASKKKTAVKKKKSAQKKASVKKTAAKKTRKRKKKTRRRFRSTLSQKELVHFRELLLAKWAELLGDVNSIESEALRKSRLESAGDLSSMPIHMADIGTDNFEQEFALGLMNSERKILVEIIAALKRIEANTYGICEGTGKPIPKPRLEAVPWARYCVEYATMVEKGLVIEGDTIYDDEEEFDEDELDDYDDDDYDLMEDYDDDDADDFDNILIHTDDDDDY